MSIDLCVAKEKNHMGLALFLKMDQSSCFYVGTYWGFFWRDIEYLGYISLRVSVMGSDFIADALLNCPR